MTQRYARKPLIVEAECFDGTPEHADALRLVCVLMPPVADEDPCAYFLETADANRRERVRRGDYIVTFLDGTRKCARSAIFEAEFTPITPRTPKV